MNRLFGLSVASFLLAVAFVSPGAAQELIVDSADTHVLWHMEEIEPNVTVPDLIFGGSFTSDAILDDDSSFPRAHYQDLLLGQTFLQFPQNTRPTLTTGGGGVIGEALDFNGTNMQAISILGWLGDGDDGTGLVNPANAFPTMYTDFWFRERDQDGINVMIQATSTWTVDLTNGAVNFTAWDSNFGTNTISIDLDQFGTDGEPDAKWRHAVAFVDESGTQSLSVDDITVTGTLNGTLKLQRKSITLGNKENNARWYDGLIDEVYIGFAPPTFALAGDYDGDGFVGQSDLDQVLLNWGDTSPPAPSGWVNEVPAGLIGQASLDGVLLNWGNGTAPIVGAVPEPTSVLLLCLGGALVLCTSRRK